MSARRNRSGAAGKVFAAAGLLAVTQLVTRRRAGAPSEAIAVAAPARRRSRKLLAAPAVALVVAVGLTGTAVAFWTASGSGAGSVAAASLSKPTNVTATGLDQSSIQVSWTASVPALAGTHYVVMRDGATQVCDVTVVSCTDSGLAASTSHSYTIEARVGAWTSGATGAVTGSTTAVPAAKTLSFTSSTPACTGGAVTLAAGTASFTSKVSRANSTGAVTVNLTTSAGSLSPTSLTIVDGQNESSSFFTLSGLTAGSTTTVTAAATDHTSATCAITVGASVPDTQPPVVVMKFPTTGSYITGNNGNARSWTKSSEVECTSDTICGTATDANSGVAKVEIAFKQTSTGKWWSGTFGASSGNFTETTIKWIELSGTSNWTLAWPASSFPGTGTYSVQVRATDVAGNVAATSEVTFNTTKN